jgi:hypothetical protein
MNNFAKSTACGTYLVNWLKSKPGFPLGVDALEEPGFGVGSAPGRSDVAPPVRAVPDVVPPDFAVGVALVDGEAAPSARLVGEATGVLGADDVVDAGRAVAGVVVDRPELIEVPRLVVAGRAVVALDGVDRGGGVLASNDSLSNSKKPITAPGHSDRTSCRWSCR